MIYNDLIDDIKSADYVLFGLGKEIYSSDDTEIYDNLKKLFASMEHVNYFIVSTDKAGTIRNCGLNERRIVCPVNEIMLKKRRNSGISTINGCHPHLQRSWLLWNLEKIFLTLML